MTCDNCGKDLGKFALAIPEKAYGLNKCLLCCGSVCFRKKVKELQEKQMAEKVKKTMASRNGICPFCSTLYEIEGDADTGHCQKKACANKAGDVNRIETNFTSGVKTVTFTSGSDKGMKTVKHKCTNGTTIIAGGTSFKTMAPIMDVSPAKAKKAEADSLTRAAKDMANEQKEKSKKTTKKASTVKKVSKKATTKKPSKAKAKAKKA